MVFHRRLCDSKSPQLSRTLLSILAVFNIINIIIIIIIIYTLEFFKSASADDFSRES